MICPVFRLRRAWSRAALLALLLPLVPAALATRPLVAAPPAAQQAPRVLGEMRGLWVTRSWMTSPERVAQVVEDAAGHGLSAVFVQVRGRGDAFYLGGPDPRSPLLAGQPGGYDPLADLLDRAAQRGLEVHAWVNVNLVAGATDLPKDPNHVIRRHPEWVMVPRALAASLVPTSPTSPGYLPAIARWTEQHKAQVEGLYTSPIPAAAQDHLVAVVSHLVRTYPLDGVHLDYIRYPGAEFDYSRAALDAFRADLLPDLSPAERTALEASARRDPLAHVSRYPERWLAFRQQRLTHLVGRLRAVVRDALPAARLTTAVWPDGDDAIGRKMQNWPLWLETGLIDAVCPMMYTTSATTFARQLTDLRGQPAGRVWPGIGVYRIPANEAARRVAAARQAGFDGVLLFSYDSMSDGVGRRSAYLSSLRRDVFAAPALTVSSASAP